MTYAPVFIRNARLDIVAENSMFGPCMRRRMRSQIGQ